MLFAALLRCTSYNGNAIFSGNQRQSISFAQDSTVRAGLDGSRRVSRSRRTRRFTQDSTVRAEYLVRAGLDGSRRTRRFAQSISFAQDSTVRAGLDGSRRSRRFAQDSTVLAGLDGSRRTRRFTQDSTVLADRTRRFAQDSTVRAGLDPFGRYGIIEPLFLLFLSIVFYRPPPLYIFHPPPIFSCPSSRSPSISAMAFLFSCVLVVFPPLLSLLASILTKWPAHISRLLTNLPVRLH